MGCHNSITWKKDSFHGQNCLYHWIMKYKYRQEEYSFVHNSSNPPWTEMLQYYVWQNTNTLNGRIFPVSNNRIFCPWTETLWYIGQENITTDMEQSSMYRNVYSWDVIIECQAREDIPIVQKWSHPPWTKLPLSLNDETQIQIRGILLCS